MNNAPHNHNDQRSESNLEQRLRRDARRAMQPAPAGLRSRVMREVVAAGSPAQPRPWKRGPILASTGLALAACLVVLIGAALVQPNSAIDATPLPPPQAGADAPTTLFGLFDRFEDSARQAPNRIFVQTVAGEVDRLREDATRASRPLQAAWAPIKAILATQ